MMVEVVVALVTLTAAMTEYLFKKTSRPVICA